MEIRRVLSVDQIKLSPRDFWMRPIEEREGAFATLREECPVHWDEEEEIMPNSPIPAGPGYW